MQILIQIFLQAKKAYHERLHMHIILHFRYDLFCVSYICMYQLFNNYYLINVSLPSCFFCPHSIVLFISKHLWCSILWSRMYQYFKGVFLQKIYCIKKLFMHNRPFVHIGFSMTCDLWLSLCFHHHKRFNQKLWISVFACFQ